MYINLYINIYVYVYIYICVYHHPLLQKMSDMYINTYDYEKLFYLNKTLNIAITLQFTMKSLS